MQVSECSVPALTNTFYRLLLVLGYKEAKIIYSSEGCGSKVSVNKELCLSQRAVYSGTEDVPPTAGLTQELGQDAYLFTRTSGLNTTEFFISRKPLFFCIPLLGISKAGNELY